MKKYLKIAAIGFAALVFVQNSASARGVSMDKNPVNYTIDNAEANKKTAKIMEELLKETKKTNLLLEKLIAK